jgi:catechol 2,3-dioxygenase-like lactoylglutathione lyase family enzyme
MLADKDAIATIAVKDLAKAKAFYSGKLGFKPVGAPDDDNVVTFKSGNAMLLVYRSEFGGSNKATSVTWSVGTEFDDVVQALQDADVPFEHYDLPGLQRSGNVHAMGEFKAAWFKDPDGNILHVNNM